MSKRRERGKPYKGIAEISSKVVCLKESSLSLLSFQPFQSSNGSYLISNLSAAKHLQRSRKNYAQTDMGVGHYILRYHKPQQCNLIWKSTYIRHFILVPKFCTWKKYEQYQESLFMWLSTMRYIERLFYCSAFLSMMLTGPSALYWMIMGK